MKDYKINNKITKDKKNNTSNNLVFSSITQALKAQNLLNNLKIKSKIEKISNQIPNVGCAYQLTFFNSNKNNVQNILIKNNINFFN